ncbi:MAG: class I SAM-dependent methyltransferase, partial [Bacteroidales bacterium]|nr:class I SAM-dependent methyltransferase [Bacteroidales bacterium]
TVLDVGTGGGFPGIPLAVLFPEVRFTLCDSIGKKVKVAQAVADGLQLGNVTCVNARAEALPETYDFVVSRAVTDLATFYPWVRGKFRYAVFYLKGGDLSEEIDTCVRRCRLDPATLFQAPVSTWFEDPWFAEKKILMISQ